MADTLTVPTDEDLVTTRKVLIWLAVYLAENEPRAILSLGILKRAAMEIPGSIAELEGLK